VRKTQKVVAVFFGDFFSADPHKVNRSSSSRETVAFTLRAFSFIRRLHRKPPQLPQEPLQLPQELLLFTLCGSAEKKSPKKTATTFWVFLTKYDYSQHCLFYGYVDVGRGVSYRANSIGDMGGHFT
jgi:hypothetical protein